MDDVGSGSWKYQEKVTHKTIATSLVGALLGLRSLQEGNDNDEMYSASQFREGTVNGREPDSLAFSKW